MPQEKPSTPTPPATRKKIETCWCGHKREEHTGEDGMCKFNTESPDSCECGGFESPR